MMLDMKRTFDEVVEAHATPDKAARSSPTPSTRRCPAPSPGPRSTWRWRSWAARAEADRDGSWDLIIVDTPPSRSALDFLDAPKRLGSFLDGRFIRLLAAPAKAGSRAYLKVFSVGVNLAANTLAKILGGQILTDVQTFVAALDTMFGGFRERADLTYALLKEPATAFLVVAAPERDALREAAYFVDRLAEEQMPLAGLVVNRVQPSPPGLSPPPAAAAAEQLEDLAEDGRRPSPRRCCACTPRCDRGGPAAGAHPALPRRPPGRAGRRGAGRGDRRPRPGGAARGRRRPRPLTGYRPAGKPRGEPAAAPRLGCPGAPG